ncbi:MAG TPA: hypothetical protein PKW00_04570 [Rectinema sp.]|nr:hypothetical protein [Rectinema sp.]
MDRERISKPVILLFILTLVLSIATVVTIQVFSRYKPDIRSKFNLYLEKLEPQSMLVVATTQERYEASKEFTAKLLAIFNIRAKIRLSAVADVTYIIPASDPSAWSIDWNSKARKIVLSSPAPDCLLPAVHTETIEIITENQNILTNTIFKLKEEAAHMQAELSNDFLVRARATLTEPAVRATIEDGLKGFAIAFCESAHLGKPTSIEIHLGESH